MMGGSSLDFLLRETTGVESVTESPGFHFKNFETIDRHAIVFALGSIWPYPLYALCSFLLSGVMHPQAVFKSPMVRYAFETTLYGAYLYVFTRFIVLEGDESRSATLDLDLDIDTIHRHVSTAVDDLDVSIGEVWLASAESQFSFFYAFAVLIQELHEMWEDRPFPFVKYWTAWNGLELSASVMILTGFTLRDGFQDSHYPKAFFAWAAVLLWIKLLEPLQLVEGFGTLIAVIGRMLATMVQFSFLLVIFMLAFGVGMHALLRGDIPDFGTYDEPRWQVEFYSKATTFNTMFEAIFGSFSYNFAGAEHKLQAEVMFGLYLLLILILLLNLLIAILSAEHAKVSEDVEKELNLASARIILNLQGGVNDHKLPPPLSLLQVFWPMRRRIAWATCGLIFPLVSGFALCVVVIPASVCIALQATSLPFIKRRHKYPFFPFNKLDPENRFSPYRAVPTLLPILAIAMCPLIIVFSVLQSVSTFIKAIVTCKRVASIDKHNDDGELSIRSAMQVVFPVRDAETIFRGLDTDNRGFITKDQLQDMCSEMGRPLTPEELDDAMEEIDAEEGGTKITWERFRKLLRAHSVSACCSFYIVLTPDGVVDVWQATGGMPNARTNDGCPR